MEQRIIGADVTARLSQLDTCTLSDALDALGLTGVAVGPVPLWEGARLAGPAVTVKLAPGAPDDGLRRTHLGARAIDRARPGSVIVVDNGGRTEMGGWGGLLSLAASRNGVAGVVLDGACRDVDEARALGFPVFARCAVARTARRRVYEESTGEPVHIAGIPVGEGDLVVADGSGVVVLPQSRVLDVLAEAELLAAREQEMSARLKAGAPVGAVLGHGYESMIGNSPADEASSVVRGTR
ncbi:RraA family protein [Actinospica sp.]|jgi:regulator of RNase E activity RraA|uniref:RraA family protein n=1 Tax=Actinospica sp. TaxID=1872142 RepID=UPI002C6716AA|nr:RraA family protein [Actinospica sp.]HWG25564.1 RraA family protein [Actinospica sp.]